MVDPFLFVPKEIIHLPTLPDANECKVYYLRSQNGGAYVVSMELEYSGGMALAVFSRVLLVLPYLWSRKV